MELATAWAAPNCKDGIGPATQHTANTVPRSLLSLSHPRLLRSLVLIDPVIQVPSASVSPATASTPRRDIWPSRDAAAEKFRATKFYQAWDPRVLDRWVQYGLRPVPTELYPAAQDDATAPDERVTLTTSKHQELFTFIRPTYRGVPGETFTDRDPIADEEYPGWPFYRPEPIKVFRQLPELRPSVLYIFGSQSELSTPTLRREKMERTGTGFGGSGGAGAGRVSEVLLDCGHLVAMERVTQCADAIAAHLAAEVARWRREKDEYEEYWRGKTRREQMTIDEQWAARVRPSVRKTGHVKL